ncbi:hypothetical protein [Calothrix sp. NIES-3974]|nr:hypothetical protein [Calothrix sp. NIES-3974]
MDRKILVLAFYLFSIYRLKSLPYNELMTLVTPLEALYRGSAVSKR